MIVDFNIYTGEDTIIVDGVEYRWNDTKYEKTIQLDNFALNGIGVNRTVTVNFFPIINSTNSIGGNDLRIFVDGIEWLGENIVKNNQFVQVTFNEIFLCTQRIITFKSNKGICKNKYSIMAQVSSDNDVVLLELNSNDVVPDLIELGRGNGIINNTSPVGNVNTNDTNITPVIVSPNTPRSISNTTISNINNYN